MKKLIFCASLFAITATAHAAYFELGLGQTQFTKPENGVWWQNPFPSNFALKHYSYNLGLNFRATEHLRIRAGYMSLGGVTSAARATGSDADYATQKCGGPCIKLSNWYGESSVAGEYLTVDPEIELFGIKVFGELGAYYSSNQFSMTIPDWRNSTTCPPRYMQVTGNGHAVSPILGFGMQVQKFQLAVNYISLQGSAAYPPNYDKNTYNISIRYLF